MSVAEFCTELRRCRLARGLSQPDVAHRSGMSVATVQKYERRRPTGRPERPTVIALAAAVGLDVNRALRMVGYEALTPTERVTNAVPVVVPPGTDPRGELDALWPALTPEQQRLMVTLAATILSRPLPHAVDGGSTATGFVKMDFTHLAGVAARVRAAAREPRNA